MDEELWALEVDDPEWLPTVIQRLLSVGVPPTAVSKAFDLDVQVVKEYQVTDRIARYGTAELGEAMHFLMWKAYEDTVQLLERAPMSKRLSMNMALLSKASTLVGSQTPDGIARMQSLLGEMFAETRRTDEEVKSSIYETNPLDAPPDDPEEGSTGRAS